MARHDRRLIWSGIFDGQFENRERAVRVFEEHRDQVQSRCDPDRLLVFDVSDGWEPLCAFLDVPAPSRPFPYVNDAATLQRRFAAIRWGTRLAPVAALGLGGAAVQKWRRRA